MNSFSGPALEQNTALGLTLVLAEDNPVNQTLTRSLLEQLGHRVLTVADGSQALEALKQQPVDVLMLDVMMPGLDGLTTLQTLRNIAPRLSMIAVSGLSTNQQPALSAGANVFLAKPCTTAELLVSLRTLILENHR